MNYFGGYIQDDFRVSSKLTVNAGLRIESESGLKEEEDRFTVAFDRTINPGGTLGSIVNPLTGQPMRGGLVYAGVNGAPTEQGNQPAAKFSPRVGMVYSVNPKTVIRTGYGVYQAPWNYQFVGAANYGQVGYSQNTFMQQGQFVPTTSLTNPFPGGVVAAARQLAGRPRGCRQPDRVHRPGQGRALRAAGTRSTSTASCPATSRWASSTPAPPAATSAWAVRTTAR